MAEQEPEPKEMSVKDVFRQVREAMGHNWPVGTFNPEGPTVIEGEYKVMGDRPEDLSNSRELTQKLDNQLLPEVTNG